MSNIILVGMPACGKSIIGVVLAKAMKKQFIDTDLLIQKRERKALQDIIHSSGIEYFKKVEEAILLELHETNTVISTGGSAIYYPDAIQHLKTDGVVVYMKVTLETIQARLNNIKTRGVTLGPGETIEDLYARRIPLYEKRADLVIDTEGLSVEETVEIIMERLA